jgi:uncharacterized metal-binding protein
MPNGEEHVLIGGTVGLATALFVAADYGPTITRSFALGSAVALFAMGPDLDQEGTTIQEHFMYGIPVIGWAFGFLYQWFWYGYARAFKHRSFWSHGPLVSTGIRILYVLLLCWVYWLMRGQPVDFWPRLQEFVLPHLTPAFFVGMVFQDGLHWLADQFVKAK